MAIIDKPSDYFNTVLYTGNGYPTAGTQSITGVGFQPDWLWIKDRDATQNNNLSDVIRGASFRLKSNASSEESELTDSVVSHDSDGFSVGTGSDVNQNSDKYVAWNWKAGGTASSNTDGSITSSVSANQDAGFSIVSFDLTSLTGNQTVGHGLNTAPKVVITKRRSGGAGDWTSYFGAIGNSYLVLNKTSAGATTADFMNNTAPTSSVFTVGDPSWWGANPFISYCFAEKQGYSKFGSYTGNGNSDGTFVYTGFKPAWIMLKRTDGANDWILFDNKRLGYNGDNKRLYPNQTYVEDTTGFDLLSNGFKARMTGTTINGSGNSYIYMAFAENPFVTSTGVPATAR